MNERNLKRGCKQGTRALSAIAGTLLWLLGGLTAAANAGTNGGSAPIDPQPRTLDGAIYGTDGGYRKLAERVDATQTTQYDEIVGEYEAFKTVHPEDTIARLEECRFMRRFAESDELVVESAPIDAEQCDHSLRAPRFERDGAIQMYLLDQLSGVAALDQAERLLPEAYAWPQPLRARLYERLATEHRAKRPELADGELESALQLDPLSPRRLDVVRRYMKLGARSRALQVLFDTPAAAWPTLPIVEAAQLLYELGAPSEAVKLLQGYHKNAQTPKGRLLLAQTLEAVGDMRSARAAYSEALATEYGTRIAAGPYFEFELRHGSRAQSESAYDRLRVAKPLGDPWGRFRLALFLRYPASPWAFRDAVGVARFLAALSMLALLPVVVVAPIHYRSLAKRLHGWCPSAGTWGLRTAWYILASVFVLPVLAMYMFAYDDFAAATLRLTSTPVPAGMDTELLGVMLICQTTLLALCTVPVLWGTDLRALILGHASFRRAASATVVALVMLGSAAIVYAGLLRGIPHHAALGDLTTRAIQTVQATCGTAFALLLVAVLVPLIEETLFRGILLQSLSRYVSFRWAALIQALVFANVHESLQAFPYLVIVGLLTAWLVRRTGGVLAGTCLHGINNAVAFMVMMGTAFSVNAGG